MEQELQRPQILRVNKEDYIHGTLAGTFDLNKLAKYTHVVCRSTDYYGQTYRQLDHHETFETIYMEYENPNGTLELSISFELTDEFILFFSHEAYVEIQKADGWFDISQHCRFKENPCYRPQ
jgi:hypothetical protein